jgi:hypothetical protein
MAGEGASGAGVEVLGASRADVLSLFLRLLPPDHFRQLREQQEQQTQPGRRQNNRVYNDAVVIWLMIQQRLSANASLEAAVLELGRGLPGEFWPQPCKRLREQKQQTRKLSGNTGSYNQARQELPLSIAEHCGDRVFVQLMEQLGRDAAPESGAASRRAAFFVDGSSMRMPHSEALSALYPPGSNQHGESHWPLLRIVVAHDLYTGLAMRPQWGAMNGEQAVSEQGLLEQAIDRLPGGCVVLGDANFGVFSVAYLAAQRGHPVVLRLTAARAKRLAGRTLPDSMDLRICWQPSQDDRRNHPELPPDACVRGRLIVRQVQPGNGGVPILLALFTTLEEDKADPVVELYGRRWNIETDLRSLKDTLRLDQLTSTTPEMVAKEIDIALLAYNLVRAVICVAAQRAGLPPRQYSFTRVRNIINAFAPLIMTARDEREAQHAFEKMMYYVSQAKLPRRRRKRPSYPRAVWPKPHKYPKRKQ